MAERQRGRMRCSPEGRERMITDASHPTPHQSPAVTASPQGEALRCKRQFVKLEFDKEVIHVTENCVWKKAQTVELKVSENILPEFSIGFDKRIPIEVEQELRSFVTWVENSYRIPITLWVDFEYNHYLISRSGKRVGYLFYWADFSSYPVFDNSEDVPQIRLPVRTEHSTIEEILTSFIEAITDYYAWLCNEIYEGYTPNEDDVEEILQTYLCSRK